MSSRLSMLLAFLVAVAAAGAPAAAQTLPEAGSWSLTATLPDGGGNIFGAWRMMTDRVNLGLEVDFRNVRQEDEPSNLQLGARSISRRHSFVVGPSVKYYMTVRHPIAAYLRASAGFGWSDEELERPIGTIERDTTDKTQIYRIAVGADWFPVSGVAIGAFTGLVHLRDKIEVQINNAGSLTRTVSNWSTFKSGIELQLFF